MELGTRFKFYLTIFVVGLVLLGIAVPIAAIFVQRRGRAASDDHVLRLIRNSAVPLVLQIGNRAIDFAFGIVLYTLLTDSQAAITNYEFAGLVVTLLFATIAEWGLNIYLTREVARDRAAIARTFGTTLAIRFALAVLVLPGSALVVLVYNWLSSAGLIANGIDAQGRVVMLVLAATILPSAFSGAVTALFLATERPIVPAVIALLTNVGSTLLRIAMLLLGFGVVGMAWTALGATIVNALVFGVLLRRVFGWPGLRVDRAQAAQIFRAGFPLMLNALLLAVFFRFDQTIIRGTLRPVEYNAYSAAYKYVGLTQILPPIVINAIFPLFARQAIENRAALQRAYAYTVRLLVLIALPLAVMVTVAARWLMLPYGGDEPAIVTFGAPALALLIWYLPFSYVNGVTQYVLIALDRPRTITLSFAIAAVFNLVFNLLFIPRYGINAAAIATVLSEIVLYLPLRQTLRRELEPPALWRTLWRPLVAAGGMIAGMLALALAHIGLAVVLGPILFGGLLVLLGAVEEEDRRLARRMLRRT